VYVSDPETELEVHLLISVGEKSARHTRCLFTFLLSRLTLAVNTQLFLKLANADKNRLATLFSQLRKT